MLFTDTHKLALIALGVGALILVSQRAALGGTMFYSRQRITAKQAAAADLIVAECQAQGVNPQFMLALAVTESSLNPLAAGDDGVSLGLFQMKLTTARSYNPMLLSSDLFVPGVNTRVACDFFRDLMRQFPGRSYGDYAEAWTLGAHGRFILGRRNPVKLANMHRAIADLDLTLLLNEVAT